MTATTGHGRHRRQMAFSVIAALSFAGCDFHHPLLPAESVTDSDEATARLALLRFPQGICSNGQLDTLRVGVYDREAATVAVVDYTRTTHAENYAFFRTAQDQLRLFVPPPVPRNAMQQRLGKVMHGCLQQG